MTKEKIPVLLDVPAEMRQRFRKNYVKITKGSGRLMLLCRRPEGGALKRQQFRSWDNAGG